MGYNWNKDVLSFFDHDVLIDSLDIVW
jgi:hypothetical protein